MEVQNREDTLVVMVDMVLEAMVSQAAKTMQRCIRGILTRRSMMRDILLVAEFSAPGWKVVDALRMIRVSKLPRRERCGTEFENDIARLDTAWRNMEVAIGTSSAPGEGGIFGLAAPLAPASGKAAQWNTAREMRQKIIAGMRLRKLKRGQYFRTPGLLESAEDSLYLVVSGQLGYARGKERREAVEGSGAKIVEVEVPQRVLAGPGQRFGGLCFTDSAADMIARRPEEEFAQEQTAQGGLIALRDVVYVRVTWADWLRAQVRPSHLHVCICLRVTRCISVCCRER
eukprot:COSAG05_NODE_476_length_9460_cov_8.847025_2_plen_286_part_00